VLVRDRAQGETWLRKLRAVGKTGARHHRVNAYVALQTSADELLAPGRYYYMKSGMLSQLKDDGIDLLIDSYSACRTGTSYSSITAAEHTGTWHRRRPRSPIAT